MRFHQLKPIIISSLVLITAAMIMSYSVIARYLHDKREIRLKQEVIAELTHIQGIASLPGNANILRVDYDINNGDKSICFSATHTDMLKWFTSSSRLKHREKDPISEKRSRYTLLLNDNKILFIYIDWEKDEVELHESYL